MSPQDMQTIVDGLDNNRVANFSYTDNAFNNNDVDGVAGFSTSVENNIPDAANTELNQTILNRGAREQVSSIPRGALNHFWGRTSYNLNKLVQVVKRFFRYIAKIFAHNCFEYDASAKYLNGDVCYVIHDDVISIFKRVGTNPTEIQGISPLLNDTEWEFISPSDIPMLINDFNEALARRTHKDIEPIEDSNNLISSGAVYDALENKVDKIATIAPILTPAAKKFACNAQGQITGTENLTPLDAGLGYGTCTTVAATNTKVGTLAGFVRSTGAVVAIKFSNANTAANPTLSVNSTGAAAIIDYRTGVAVTPKAIGNRIHFFQFDGANWILMNPVDVNRYYVSFKITSGSDYLTFGLIVNDSFFANEISGNTTFVNITIAEFITAMKTYFSTLNTASKAVTIGGASGYWQGSYINHVSFSMVNSTVTLRLLLNTSNSAYTFDLPNGANPPQFAVNVTMLN